MNINHDLKVIWWLPMRTATRSVAEILSYYKFFNTIEQTPLSLMSTHAIGIPSGCEDYKIICNIRNPYAKVLSIWHLSSYKQNEVTGKLIIERPFSEFVEKSVSSQNEESQILSQPRKPDLYIRTENLVEDLRKVSFIDFNDPTIQGIIDIWIKRNNYTSEGCKENQHPDFDLTRDPNKPTLTDYKRYYTQKELDIVWKLYENVFNEFGYQREFI